MHKVIVSEYLSDTQRKVVISNDEFKNVYEAFGAFNTYVQSYAGIGYNSVTPVTITMQDEAGKKLAKFEIN